MSHKIKINNRTFIKSSKSDAFHCVGVEIRQEEKLVSVINTNKRDKIIDFTFQEWNAFLSGVHAGEFKLP